MKWRWRCLNGLKNAVYEQYQTNPCWGTVLLLKSALWSGLKSWSATLICFGSHWTRRDYHSQSQDRRNRSTKRTFISNWPKQSVGFFPKKLLSRHCWMAMTSQVQWRLTLHIQNIVRVPFFFFFFYLSGILHCFRQELFDKKKISITL